MALTLAPPRRPAPSSPAPSSPAQSSPASSSRAQRDTGIDLVRALCVGIVVLLHALMAGVTVDASGPVFANAADGAAWFTPLTWAMQVMPLFFLIGGFAGALAYRRSRERGATAIDFITARVHRLLLPAALTVAVVGVALTALVVAGVPAELVQVAGFRFGQPLWFLGVFLLCQALLPALLTAHERAPWVSMACLVGAAVLVDVVRALSGIDGLGFVNLAFVWLALQQLGFFLAEGRIDALRRRTRVVGLAAAVFALAGAFTLGIYSPDLYANLNPPTTALLLVGVAQTALLTLLRRPIARFSERPRVAAFTNFVTARAMTIYLWHMPVLLTMAGAAALAALTTDLELPELSSVGWWLTRPAWLLTALALTGGVAWMLAGAERRRLPETTRSTRRGAQAVLLGLAGVVLLLVAGTGVITAAISVALLLLALARIRAARPRAGRGVHRGSGGLTAAPRSTPTR